MRDHVDQGDMRLFHVIAVPRAVSTALSRALNETPGSSVYVNEPFNHLKHDINEASSHILKAVEPMLESGEGPVTVVAKNMARNLGASDLEKWTELCSGTVWSIRNPRIQIASLITRIANNLICGSGSDTLKQEDLTREQVKLASDFLEDGPRSVNFAQTGWKAIGGHFARSLQPERSVVIDAGELTLKPHEVLAGACRNIGLNFSSNMLNGWQGGVFNANAGYNPDLADKDDAWTHRALSSTGITPTFRKPIDDDILPPSLQAHISDVAMPTYEKMVAE